MIVRISFEAVESVCGDLVLVIDFGDHGSNVVRVKFLVRRDVIEDDDGTIDDGFRRRVRFGEDDGGIVGAVEEEPIVVFVAMRIESDLLFCCRVR